MIDDDEDGLLDADCFDTMGPQIDFNLPSAANSKQTFVPNMAVFTIMEAEDSDEEDY